MDGSLSSPSGGIRVRTTERGLPIMVKLDQGELSKPPMQLAQEILLLCQLAAKRMQVVRRRGLVAGGFSPTVIRGLNLSTEDELARAQVELRDDPEDLPDTWMHPV